MLVVAVRILTFRVELDYRRERDEESYFVSVGVPPLFSFTSDSAPPERDEEDGPLMTVLERLHRSADAGLDLAPEDQPHDPAFARLVNEARLVVRQVRALEQIITYLRNGRFIVPEDAVWKRRWLRFGLEALARTEWHADELVWVTRIGAGDPALTGLLSGLLWGSKVTAFGALGHRMVFGKTPPMIRVVPNFTGTEFATRFRCIVRVHVGHIIRAGLGIRAS